VFNLRNYNFSMSGPTILVPNVLFSREQLTVSDWLLVKMDWALTHVLVYYGMASLAAFTHRRSWRSPLGWSRVVVDRRGKVGGGRQLRPTH
jgi:hypothetical protein